MAESSIRKVGFITISVVALTIFCAVWARTTSLDMGILDAHTLEDFSVIPVSLEYAWADTDSMVFSSEQNAISQYELEQSDVIAIAKSKNHILQNEGSFAQEIEICKVIKGEEFLSDHPCYVVQSGGFRVIENQTYFCNASLNVLKHDCEYLMFLKVSELNHYQNLNVFLLQSEDFGYIRTDFHETETISSDFQELNFFSLTDCEFFSTSEKVTSQLNQIRWEILKHYL